MIELIKTSSGRALQVIVGDQEIQLLATDRSKLTELTSLLRDLLERWLLKAFSTGEVASDPESWDLMRRAVALLPRRENPATTGFDLDLLGNDYDQIEDLFFSDASSDPLDLHQWRVAAIDLDKYRGGKILALHRINPRELLLAADRQRLEKLQTKVEGELANA